MKTDIAIVGGGILGTFHAYHALEKGLSVRLFETNTQPNSATVRNFGQVVPSGMNRKWQRIGRESLQIYKSLQEKIDISVRNNGTVYLASNEEEMILLEELQQINQGEAYPSQMLTKEQCLDKYPGLKADYCVGGLFFPEELSVEPRVCAATVQQYMIEQMNLEIYYRTTIQAVEIAPSACVLFANNGEVYEADQVIICNGADYSTLYPEKFQNSDLVAVKLQMMQTQPLVKQQIPGNILTGLSIRRYESFSECPSYASIKAKEPAESLAKEYGVHILFKQALDGSVIIGDSHEYAPARELDQLGFNIRGDINDFIFAEAKKIFDLENWNISASWYGIYGQCKEKDIFQETIEEKVHIVTGIGGKGMTGSPGFAKQTINKFI